MTNLSPGKRKLPFPYDQDLSGVLKGLKPKTPAARARQANDVTTASCLVAAMRLLEQELGPTRKPRPSRQTRPLLTVLSAERVAAEMANNPASFSRRATEATIRGKWASKEEFVADVLRFGLWSRHYLGSWSDELRAAIEKLVSADHDFADAVQETCFYDLLGIVGLPVFRLQYLAAAAGAGDDIVTEALADNFADVRDAWQGIYIAAMEAHGLHLRAGITLDDAIRMFAAAADGLALHFTVDPTARILDREKRQSMFGTIALVMILGCLERDDSPDGLTLDEAVRAKVTRPNT